MGCFSVLRRQRKDSWGCRNVYEPSRICELKALHPQYQEHIHTFMNPLHLRSWVLELNFGSEWWCRTITQGHIRTHTEKWPYVIFGPVLYWNILWLVALHACQMVASCLSEWFLFRISCSVEQIYAIQSTDRLCEISVIT